MSDDKKNTINKMAVELAKLIEEDKVFNNKNSGEFDSKRTNDNEKLINTLSELSKQNPSLRFSQLLSVFGFVTDEAFEKHKYWKNEFYTEPGDVFLRVAKILKKRSLKGEKK